MGNKHFNRNAHQAERQRQRLPPVIGKASASGIKVPLNPKPSRTVHVSELTHAKMSTGNYRHFRNVIDHGALLEWVGFQWIFIRPAQPEDSKVFPQVVRGHG